MSTVGTLETVMATARAVMASLALNYEIDSGINQDMNNMPANPDEIFIMFFGGGMRRENKKHR